MIGCQLNHLFIIFGTQIHEIIIDRIHYLPFHVHFIMQMRTQIDEMPLVEVISRVNRIHRWTIRERLIAIAFLLVLAILSFIYWQVWQYGMGMIAFFILLWGGGLGLILWIYRKKFLNRIHEIKKNLSELNELM